MRPLAFSVVLLAILGAACSTTQVVQAPETFASFSAMERKQIGYVDVVTTPLAEADNGGSERAPVAPIDEHVVERRRLLYVSDAGVVVDGDSAPHMLELAQLRGYDVTSHWQGATEGLGIGALAGVAAGALAGFAAGADPPCDPNEFLGCAFHLSAGDKAVIGGVLGLLTGAVSGIVIGAIVGHTDHYVFAPE